MSLKTENLAIVLTAIAGYTEVTQSQSRLDNARLLATQNRILSPIIRRYKGRHVKSIGDGLLLVFRSPTDAMLCAMALQDALFEYNRNASREQQIHIRVAASLGEVRVTRNDVFGEAVNLTSRIEGITPADEIYMSEAVYMAMNKAEVPSQEVGFRELKGISGTVRLFNIPRFSTLRLVPQDVMAAADMSDLVYPYGGAHLGDQAAEGEGWGVRLARSRVARAALIVLVLAPMLALAGYVGRQLLVKRGASAPVIATASAPAPDPVAATELQTRPEVESAESKPVAVAESRPAPVPDRPSTERRLADRLAARRAAMVATSRQSNGPAARTQYEPEFDLKKDAPPTSPDVVLSIARLSEAKKAYKEDRISKDDYRHAVDRIEKQMDKELDQAKRDYKSDKITRKEYKERVEAIRKKYQ